ncbi:hypothetical protein EDEG_03196 [Edhazardia aedis USNM 41457]|uniref:Uncharacterized protein n=1 Tax=Edhazardia aedis (strain USNM 41457) TaxID=1003232 RepID=J8ZRQ0_EDHAE|nr:hypothetical protein EDEG_03196 [Edhazardia aedis USNM 41457]|eukprot:EJW02373.1 hypothetical protein EDEG_03196 [Edhazardia aedis USNM 41457]
MIKKILTKPIFFCNNGNNYRLTTYKNKNVQYKHNRIIKSTLLAFITYDLNIFIEPLYKVIDLLSINIYKISVYNNILFIQNKYDLRIQSDEILDKGKSFSIPDVSSFTIYEDYFLFTRQDKLYIISLSTLKMQVYNINEKDAIILTVSKNNVIMNTKRGNFESFKPKIFVEKEIHEHILSGDYKSAIRLCSNNCISMDIFCRNVVDYDLLDFNSISSHSVSFIY